MRKLRLALGVCSLGLLVACATAPWTSSQRPTLGTPDPKAMFSYAAREGTFPVEVAGPLIPGDTDKARMARTLAAMQGRTRGPDAQLRPLASVAEEQAAGPRSLMRFTVLYDMPATLSATGYCREDAAAPRPLTSERLGIALALCYQDRMLSAIEGTVPRPQAPGHQAVLALIGELAQRVIPLADTRDSCSGVFCS